MTITRSGDTLTVRDATSPLVAGQWCTKVDDQTASCSSSEFQLVRAGIDLGDGDDALLVTARSAAGRGVWVARP